MLTRKHFLVGVAATVALVIVAAIVSLVQQSSGRGTAGGGVSSSALGLGLQKPGYAVAPSAPAYDMAESAGAGYAARTIMPQPYPPTAGETAAEVDQKIIKTGSLRMVVDDVAASADRIAALAVAKGGFVQNSSVSERADGTHEGSVTVRVPVDEFEAAMRDIKDFAKVVKSENATGQDVTEQYADLQAQLRNARAQEETYLGILKKAQTVEDILLVQDRLGAIRGVIESLEGRIKYLENATSFSTISVWLEEEAVVRAPTKEFRPGAVVKEAAQALIEALQQLAVAVIWTVIVGGGLVLPLLLLALLVRALWRRRRGKTSSESERVRK